MDFEFYAIQSVYDSEIVYFDVDGFMWSGPFEAYKFSNEVDAEIWKKDFLPDCVVVKISGTYEIN